MATKADKLDNQLTFLKDQVDEFLNATLDARTLSERDRDYYDGYQWTEEEIAELRRRKQQPIVVNRIKPKINGMCGLLSLRKADPKAYSRTPAHDEASHAVTDGLRYVVDNCDFDYSVSEPAFKNQLVEGYGGCIVNVKSRPDSEIDIMPKHIPWDRLYFDPHSQALDFSDARFIGQQMWLDGEVVKEMFPSAKIEDMSRSGDNYSSDDTFEDKPRWVLKNDNRTRIRIAQHFFIENGVWKMTFFTESMFLREPQDSPYLDEFGYPTCPIIIQSAFIDRMGNRYGEVRSFIDTQDELNHKRSKFTHFLNSRQTMAPKGAIKDIKSMKSELRKPDGHIEYEGERGSFEFINTNDFADGHFQLYLDAKSEIDATSFNAQLAGERQSGDLSGRAIDKLQTAGALEINGLFSNHTAWKKRVYRQIWASIKQFWDKDKWVRVTDDQDNLRWVGFNTQVTVADVLEETIKDESKPLEMRFGANMTYMALQQAQSTQLQEIVEVKNPIAELDMDIIIDESFDVVNMQQEQFQMITQFAQSGEIDIVELIELSNLRNKDALIEKIESRRKAALEAGQGKAALDQQAAQSKNAKAFAEAQLSQQKAVQTSIENQLLMTQPAKITNVSV